MIKRDAQAVATAIKKNYNVTVMTRCRIHQTTLFKGLAYNVLRHRWKYKLEEIAKEFNVDHSTVIYHIYKHKGRMNTQKYEEAYKNIYKIISPKAIIDLDEIKKLIQCILETE